MLELQASSKTRPWKKLNVIGVEMDDRPAFYPDPHDVVGGHLDVMDAFPLRDGRDIVSMPSTIPSSLVKSSGMPANIVANWVFTR